MIPQGYKSVTHYLAERADAIFHSFKANVASVKSIVVNEETGEEKIRLINNMRWRGFGPATIMFSDAQVCRALFISSMVA